MGSLSAKKDRFVPARLIVGEVVDSVGVKFDMARFVRGGGTAQWLLDQRQKLTVDGLSGCGSRCYAQHGSAVLILHDLE